jgi:CheY-like chemotaxis protein
MSKRLLLVGTDDNLQAVSQVALEGEHTWSLETCDAPGPAFELIAQNPPDAVLYDVHLDQYPFCEFARQIHSKQGDASVAIIIAGDDVNETEVGELENVWSFPSPIIPEVLITILNKSSDKTRDKRYGEEVDGAIGSVLTGAKPPRKQYEPVEGVEVQTLYGEDEDGIALDDAAKEPQPLDVVEVDDSSEFIGVNDDIDLESVEIIEEEQPADEQPEEEYEL